MSREILFRGKRTDNDKWLESVCPLGTLDTGAIINGVYPDTACQYTGLNDKNGRMIFEGDIVKLTDENNDTEWKAVVVFGNPYGKYTWGWELLYIGTKPDVNTDILLWVEIEEYGVSCEIIGNIHDNPELLKEPEQT